MVLVYLGAIRSETIEPLLHYKFATMSLSRCVASLYYSALLFFCAEWTMVGVLTVLFWCARSLAANRIRAVWLEYLANYVVAKMRQIDPEFAETTKDRHGEAFEDALWAARQAVAENHGYQFDFVEAREKSEADRKAKQASGGR
jgi:hypothetical protein